MSTDTAISLELVQRLQERVERVAKGIQDPEEMRQAGENMDRMREELRRRTGVVNVAVDLVRNA